MVNARTRSSHIQKPLLQCLHPWHKEAFASMSLQKALGLLSVQKSN